MHLEELIQKILNGTASQSEAQEYHTSDIFNSLGQSIRQYQKKITDTGKALDDWFVSEEDFYKIINAIAFVHLMYDVSDQISFTRVVGKDTWMNCSYKVLYLMHVPNAPLAEIFCYIRELNFSNSKDKHLISMKTRIDGKIKFPSIDYNQQWK